jgi:hypothetical protein
MYNKFLTIALSLTVVAGSVYAQKTDTVKISASNVNTAVLRPGINRYLVYFKNGKDSSRINYQFWTREIAFVGYHNKKAISVKQEWEDNAGLIHKVYSVSDRKTFKPLFHEIWWKNRGSASFSFHDQKAMFIDKPLTEADTAKRSKLIYGGFKQALSQDYLLNWHTDLEVFPILPFKANTTFLINFYDPGTASAPQEVAYTVSGSAQLEGYNNQKIDCWLLSHSSPGNHEVFWISKKTREVLKLEQEFNGRYRYKIKLGFGS